jgi:hypothetical protein
MLIAEARWLGSVLTSLPEHAFPLAHLGSQTGRFRAEQQPWIDELVFTPLRRMNRGVIHVDLQEAPGVDLVVDVTTEQGIAALRALQPRTILCSNLLEHVVDAHALARRLATVCPPAGYLVITGPLAFPYHPDPIDNGFRPTWQELAQVMDGSAEVVTGAEVTCRRMVHYYRHSAAKPSDALTRVSQRPNPGRIWRDRLFWALRRPRATCVVLRRR